MLNLPTEDDPKYKKISVDVEKNISVDDVSSFITYFFEHFKVTFHKIVYDINNIQNKNEHDNKTDKSSNKKVLFREDIANKVSG